MFDFTGLGTMLVGLAATVTAVGNLRIKKTVDRVATKVTAVHEEVATTNGIPLGEMLERQEGRRIEGIPAKDRTPSEQEYVNKLIAGGRDRGHEGDAE